MTERASTSIPIQAREPTDKPYNSTPDEESKNCKETSGDLVGTFFAGFYCTPFALSVLIMIIISLISVLCVIILKFIGAYIISLM